MKKFKTTKIVEELKNNIIDSFYIDNNYCLRATDRKEIIKALEKILSIFFPSRYANITTDKKSIKEFTNKALNESIQILYKHIVQIFSVNFPCLYLDKLNLKNNITPEKKAEESINSLLKALPIIRAELTEDIKTAYNGDPAASCFDEIVLSYPFVEAIATHRVAHTLYKENIPIIPRIMSEYAHSKTGIDINPGATIEGGFFIDHGTGVVIGETCYIGKNVKLYQGVTLGATSPFDKEGNPKRGLRRHPTIENNVIIYANATILGGDTVIGENSIIGGNCWITKSIPPNSLVYNNNDKNSLIIKSRNN